MERLPYETLISQMDTFTITNFLGRRTYYRHEIFLGYNNLIYGLWSFERTWGGNSAGLLEPEGTYLEIAKYGIYAKIYNNRFVDIGKISIIHDSAGSLMIRLTSDHPENKHCDQAYNVYLTNETLILQEPCGDGYSSLYSRVI